MAWLRMARRFTRGGAARLALTVLAVAWGVALVAAVHLANRAVLRAFVEVVDTMAGRAALEVVAGEGGLFPEDVAAAVATVPGVEVSAASVKGAAFADGGTRARVSGVDRPGDVPEGVCGARLELDDPLVFLARPASIALARPFAATRGLEPGDRLELATPAGRRAFTVRGLLDTEGVARAYGGNVAVMDLYAAEELFTRRGLVTGVDVVVAPEADLRRVADAIARRVPVGLRVQAPAQRQTDLRRVTESLRTALEALGLFGLVAAFLITFNRLSTVFEERAWQLGVLRAVGLRTGAVWRALLGESLLVGAAGVALGIQEHAGLRRERRRRRHQLVGDRARGGPRVRGVVLDDGAELPHLARRRPQRGGARRPGGDLGARDERLRRGARERGGGGPAGRRAGRGGRDRLAGGRLAPRRPPHCDRGGRRALLRGRP